MGQLFADIYSDVSGDTHASGTLAGYDLDYVGRWPCSRARNSLRPVRDIAESSSLALCASQQRPARCHRASHRAYRLRGCFGTVQYTAALQHRVAQVAVFLR